VQALRAAVKDGVDVRLLVPGASDIPILQPLSRAGYRSLLQAGVRVFEWNGTMLHAKTAVADSRWARVGSTNLNIASWLGNWELDVVVEHAGFGQQMEQTYLADLANATEVVLNRRRRVRPAGEEKLRRTKGTGGSASRAAAGAVRIGNVIGSALGARRLLGRAEVRLLVQGGILLVGVATLAFLFPRTVAIPLGICALWMGLALLARAARTRRRADSPEARLEARRRGSTPATPQSDQGAYIQALGRATERKP
jgi:cardiolipin synthase